MIDDEKTKLTYPKDDNGKCSASGSEHTSFTEVVSMQALEGAWLAQSEGEERQKQIEAVAAGLLGINPKDEIEGMLAAQMVATHSASMECFRRAMIESQP